MSTYEVKAGLAEVEAFDVVGITTITDNTRGTDDINALWERFFQDSIGQKVQHKTDDVIYAVYSDYEGDHTKPYRLTIGYRVNDAAKIPEDLYAISIMPQSYALLSAAGKQPEALIETWTAVWSADLARSFKTDFEVYGPRFFQDGVNEILLHIGVAV